MLDLLCSVIGQRIQGCLYFCWADYTAAVQRNLKTPGEKGQETHLGKEPATTQTDELTEEKKMEKAQEKLDFTGL